MTIQQTVKGIEFIPLDAIQETNATTEARAVAARIEGLKEAAEMADEMETHAGGFGGKITTVSYSGRLQDAIRARITELEKA